MDHKLLLERIEESFVRGVRANPETLSSGPFLISLNRATKLRWLNNASVVGDSDQITGEQVRAMCRVFTENDRMPRLELFRDLHPKLTQLLQSEGFEIECDLPVMACTTEVFQPQTAAGVQVEFLSPDSDPTTFMRVADEAFEHEEPITPERIENARRNLRRGTQWSAVASIDNMPAAVASLVIAGTVAELAGVGTIANMRRRGAASTASCKLMEQFFVEGDLIWLSAGDDIAKAVYERMGFQFVGAQIHISKPD